MSAGNSSRLSRLELPSRLLRGSALVLAAGLIAAVLLGSWRADADVQHEMRSAMAAAQIVARLGEATQGLEDEQLIDQVREGLAVSALRHLSISLRDAQGTLRLAPPAADPASPLLALLISVQRQWQSQVDPPPLVVSIPRPGADPWSLIVTPNPDSERRESLQMLLQTAAVLGASAVVLLLLLRVQILRALSPLRELLQAIEGLRQGRAGATEQLTPMPVSELQEISQALQGLARALQQADHDRRLLSLRLQSLQEDERRRMAQELHDELGQRLTALRLETTVLQRQLPGDAAPQAAAQRLIDQVQAAQSEVSLLLRRLSPRVDQAQPAQRLRELLEDLCQAAPGASATTGDLQVSLHTDWDSAPLSEAMLMALYRLSQEALTNARRHSQAQHLRLSIVREGSRWHWRCEDDGVGLDQPEQARIRGNGLAGMRERAWAFGGDLLIDSQPTGLRLSATLQDPLGSSAATAGGPSSFAASPPTALQ